MTPSDDIRDSRARVDAPPTAAEEQSETRRLKKIAFLAAFASCGRITKAAEAAGINPDTHYEWRKTDAEYKKTFDEMRERIADLLEDEAVRRAVDGESEPMIGRVARDQDGIITTVQRRSDRLLEMLLKGNRPDKFRERHEITGKDGGPIETHELTERERADRIAAILDAARTRGAGSTPPDESEVGTAAGPADDSGGD